MSLVVLCTLCSRLLDEIFSRLSCLFACHDKRMLLDPEPSSVEVMHLFSGSSGAAFLFPPTLIDVPGVFGHRCVCVFLSDVHPCWVGGWGVCRCHGGHESLFSLCYHMEATSITVRVGRFGMFGCSLVVVLSVLDPNIVRGPEVVFPSLLGCLRCVGCVVS